MTAAELDTNNTGLFKLSFQLNKSLPHSVPLTGVAHRLESELLTKALVGVVPLVLKAEDTLALVDWLTILLDLKYVK